MSNSPFSYGIVESYIDVINSAASFFISTSFVLTGITILSIVLFSMYYVCSCLVDYSIKRFNKKHKHIRLEHHNDDTL